MKKLLAHSALSLALAAPQVSAQNLGFAKVTNFVHTPESGTGVVQSKINGLAMSICNYSRVEIETIPYNLTAKHCLVGFENSVFTYDIVGLQSITNFYKSIGISNVEYESLVGLPKTVKLSQYNASTIGNRPITIVGCFPDSMKSRMVCYTITGIPTINRMGHAVLQISLRDQQRILSYDSSGMRTRISGMSGAPAFDPEGNVFGVLSMGTNVGDFAQTLLKSSQIMIEPVRDIYGKPLVPSRVGK